MTQDAPSRTRPKPQDLGSCHTMIDELFDLVDAITEDRDALLQDRDRLQQMYEELRRCLYGRRRERFEDPQQGKLFDLAGGEADAENRLSPGEPAAESPETEPAARPRQKRGGRRRLPPHFKHVRVEHPLPESEVPCQHCGELRQMVSAQISRRMNYVPGHYEVIEDVRFTYACQNDDCNGHMTTAPKPPQIIEKGAAASGLLADIAVSKFGDHLPSYRKEEISDRHGWFIPRSTQCGWLRQTAAGATLLVAFLMAQVLRSRVIHTDDTRVPVILPGEPQAHRGYFWVYVGDTNHRYSVYEFTLRHSRDGPARFLSGYEGYLQGDGYGGYEGIAVRSDGRLKLVACGTHIRRRFHAQRTYAPQVAGPALGWFRRLYVCERQWKVLSEEDRYQQRQEIAVPILADFRQWLQGQSVNVLPKSKISEAVNYALNQWDAWVRYCEAGYLAIDNNLSEQMVKPCAMGRKAWLFLGSENGGATAAILYSLTASAKANRGHPYFYLRDVFDRLPEVIHDPLILPHLQAACEAAPLSDPQKIELLGCRRAPQYLDLLRCHPRVLAERFLQNQIEPEVVAALSELLPDRWLAAHPEYRLEINRSTGIPVGMERILAD